MNLLLRATAEVVGLGSSLVTTLWISRVVGPAIFGYYAVMVTIVMLGTLVINAGLSTAGSQRVANDPVSAGQTLSAIIATRTLIAIAAIIGGLAVLAVAPFDPVLEDFLRVGMVVWVLLPFRCEWLLVAQGRVRAVAGIRAGAALATVTWAVIFIRAASDADLVAWVPGISAAVSAAGTSLLAMRSSRPEAPPARAFPAIAAGYIRYGAHYLKSDLSMFVFTSSDRLFLFAFATPAIVGLYEAAYRVIQPFYLITAVVGDAMYLRLAQSFGTNQMRPTYRRYVDLMCFATIPLGFFLLPFASSVISILYGAKYLEAGPYLAILGWVITFGYTSGVLVTPFTAWNRPREYGNATSLGGVINLGLNIALIPPFAGFGAAWSTVAAKLAVTAAGLRYFRLTTPYPIIQDFAQYFAASAAALVAALVAVEALPYPTASGMAAFGTVYILSLRLIRFGRRDRFSLAGLRSSLSATRTGDRG